MLVASLAVAIVATTVVAGVVYGVVLAALFLLHEALSV